MGIIGLETALPLFVRALIESKLLDWPGLIERMSCNPARLLGVGGGTLRAGSPADITLIDLNARYQVANAFHSKASNSPFIGMTLKAQPVVTIVGGTVRFNARSAAGAEPKSKKRARR